MGLDTVELLLAVEDRFGISIEDDEARRGLETVGDLYACVLEKVRDRNSQACRSSFVFYRVRRALMTVFQVPRNRIMPASRLEDIIPRQDRRDRWKQFSSALGWSLPDLSLPASVVEPLGKFLPLLVLSGISLLCIKPELWGSGLLKGNILLGLTLIVVVRFWEKEIPGECATAADMVQYLLHRHHDRIAKSMLQWTEKDVWKDLHALIVAQLGVEPGQVVKQARFVEDLKAD